MIETLRQVLSALELEREALAAAAERIAVRRRVNLRKVDELKTRIWNAEDSGLFKR